MWEVTLLLALWETKHFLGLLMGKYERGGRVEKKRDAGIARNLLCNVSLVGSTILAKSGVQSWVTWLSFVIKREFLKFLSDSGVWVMSYGFWVWVISWVLSFENWVMANSKELLHMHLVGLEFRISPFIGLKDKDVSTLTKADKAFHSFFPFSFSLN